jgi:hypothetical protein
LNKRKVKPVAKPAADRIETQEKGGNDRPETKATILDLEMTARYRRIIATTDTTKHGCPTCGERRADYLVWQADDEMVECSTCGHHCKP